MQHRLIKKTGARLIAVILTVHAVVLRAQDPFPSLPPGGYVPYGQSPNGYNPVYGGYQPSVVPSQPIAPIRSDSFPGGPTPPMCAAPAYGPTWQPGGSQMPGGAVQATYLGQSGPGPGTGGGRPIAPPTLCPGAQVLARVGNDVIETSDVLVAIDTVLAAAREKLPPEKFAAQRAAWVEEATAGIAAFNAHSNDPDPVKAMTFAATWADLPAPAERDRSQDAFSGLQKDRAERSPAAVRREDHERFRREATSDPHEAGECGFAGRSGKRPACQRQFPRA